MKPLSDNEKHYFNCAEYCHKYKKTISVFNTKVRDHCHITRWYCGPTLSNCNHNYKLKKIPVSKSCPCSNCKTYFIYEKNLVDEFDRNRKKMFLNIKFQNSFGFQPSSRKTW